MLIPGESENPVGKGGCRHTVTNNTGTTNGNKTKVNVRSPFQENLPYDNLY